MPEDFSFTIHGPVRRALSALGPNQGTRGRTPEETILGIFGAHINKPWFRELFAGEFANRVANKGKFAITMPKLRKLYKSGRIHYTPNIQFFQQLATAGGWRWGGAPPGGGGGDGGPGGGGPGGGFHGPGGGEGGFPPGMDWLLNRWYGGGIPFQMPGPNEWQDYFPSAGFAQGFQPWNPIHYSIDPALQAPGPTFLPGGFMPPIPVDYPVPPRWFPEYNNVYPPMQGGFGALSPGGEGPPIRHDPDSRRPVNPSTVQPPPPEPPGGWWGGHTLPGLPPGTPPWAPGPPPWKEPRVGEMTGGSPLEMAQSSGGQWQMAPGMQQGAMMPGGMQAPSFGGLPFQNTPVVGPTSIYDVIASAIPVMELERDRNISEALAQAGMGGTAFGTASERNIAEIGANTALRQNQMLTDLLYQQGQADASRALQATGQGIQLGGLTDELTRQRFQSLMPLGLWEQGRGDVLTQMPYSDWMASRDNYLPMIAQLVGGTGTPIQGPPTTTQTGGRPGLIDYAMQGAAIASMFGPFSDRRLKEKILYLPAEAIPGVRWAIWRWKRSKRWAAGVIAQDVERVMPSAVSRRHGYLYVNYARLLGVT